MKLTIKIDLDNAAFEDRGISTEVTDILDTVIGAVEELAGLAATYGKYNRSLYDSNGNHVGEATITR